MSFNIGDVVRIGKGKVEYTVDNVQPENYGQVLIKSKNTGKTQLVETDRLTLVEAAPSVFDDQTPEQEQFEADHADVDQETFIQHEDTDDAPTSTVEHPMAAWEVELLWSDKLDQKRPYLLTVDHVTTAHKSYGAACDALILASREGIENYAVIDHQGKRLATRSAA